MSISLESRPYSLMLPGSSIPRLSTKRRLGPYAPYNFVGPYWTFRREFVGGYSTCYGLFVGYYLARMLGLLCLTP
eukprot:896694-Rhodomonas_salina.5